MPNWCSNRMYFSGEPAQIAEIKRLASGAVTLLYRRATDEGIQLFLAGSAGLGAGCRERSQRSCLRPGGRPSLTQNPGLQRPERSRRPCRAVACAPGIPAKGRRDVRRNAVSRTRSPSLWRVPAHYLPGATHPYESLSPGAHTATTCRTDCPG